MLVGRRGRRRREEEEKKKRKTRIDLALHNQAVVFSR
jgi:hypothetical protein